MPNQKIKLGAINQVLVIETSFQLFKLTNDEQQG